MGDRKAVFYLILIMTAVSLVVGGITIRMLYHTALDEGRAHLVETAQSQARLIEAIARFDALYSAYDHPDGARGATLDQIIDSHQHYEGFGETGEFTLARLEGNQIIYLLSHRHEDSFGTRDEHLPVSMSSEYAVPMRRALSGRSGTVIGLDYRGVKVLAAHEPVAELNWGIVAKIDLAEIRAPFVRAGMIAGGVGLIVVLIGAVLFIRVSNPLIRRIVESEEKYSALFNKAQDGIVLVDAETAYIVDCNSAFADLAGRNIEGLRQMRIWEIRPPDKVEAAKRSFAETVERGWGGSAELGFQRPSGEVVPIDFSANVIPVRGRRFVQGIVRDISERQRAEAEIRAAHEQLLEQQQREKQHVEEELEKVRDELVRKTRLAAIGQIAASIGHELRNPLGAVRNSVYLLRRRCPKGAEPSVEYLDIIDQEVNRANRTIGNLMEMSRPKEPVRQETDLGGIVQEAVAQVHLPGGVQLRTVLEPDPFPVSADPDQLRQVLGNLLTNSVQAMDGKGRITIAAAGAGDYDIIRIQDGGPGGISPEHRARAFEPLFSTKAKGTGLGLTICRQIIEKHGGTIEWVETGGAGATFEIRLPRLGAPRVLVGPEDSNDHANSLED